MYQGELRLYHAVMLQAAQDIAQIPERRDCERYRARDAESIQSRYSAIHWLADEADYAFSFKDCCHVLGLNPLSARRNLMRLAGFRVLPRRGSLSAPQEVLA